MRLQTSVLLLMIASPLTQIICRFSQQCRFAEDLSRGHPQKHNFLSIFSQKETAGTPGQQQK